MAAIAVLWKLLPPPQAFQKYRIGGKRTQRPGLIFQEPQTKLFTRTILLKSLTVLLIYYRPLNFRIRNIHKNSEY